MLNLLEPMDENVFLSLEMQKVIWWSLLFYEAKLGFMHSSKYLVLIVPVL